MNEPTPTRLNLQPPTINLNTPQQNVPVAQPTQQLDEFDFEHYVTLGDKAGASQATITTSILSNVKASDADAFGQKLNDLIATSKAMDPSHLHKADGIFGKITALFSNAKEAYLANTQTVEQRITTLTTELDRYSSNLTKRIGDLEQLFNFNLQTYKDMQVAIDQTVPVIQTLQSELEVRKQQPMADAFEAQKLTDFQASIDRLDQQVDAWRRVQYLNQLQAPRIRAMQHDSQDLINAYKNLRNLTIPAWRGALSQFIIQLEIEKTAEIGKKAADSTEEAFRIQAEQFHDAHIKVAQLKTAPIVSIETLKHNQEQLISAVDEANKIVDAARQKRRDDEAEMVKMEQELIQKFTPQLTVK